ncbi:rod shape-determining protein MreC [Silvibacterium bohemicum]|uniref:Cell shape-determining protein MreC n=1 Tax=Silvibacterium bohemicum TaxID=1577686 RepID=A0A841JXG5_9BACT|nr:rod shape-determining protein MreC [Silvibacterium bohemicum]MBB6146052.1 rod shape-determining protein MreC [Silvibacterium bohemicum]
MESFFSRYKNALVLLLVLVMQLLVLAVQAKRPSKDASDPEAVSLIRYVVVTVVATPERLLRNFGQSIEDVWFGYIDLIHVRRDNASLKNQIEQLRLEQASVVEDARQGQRLQRLLGFKEHYIYQSLPAQVIGTSGTDQSGIVYIDKGSNDGLKPDMPVMTADGIVGRLKDVFPSTSQLMLVSDPTSGVGVILESTRTRGVLKGGAFNQVQMINVSPDDRIKPGDKIVTSGGDQIFPRGMPVGTVDRVVPDPDRDPLLDVIVHPSANLAQLEEVLVITGMGDAVSSQEEKDLAESEAEGEAAQKRASDILSERLPSKIDPSAPADTNPDSNVDSTGNVVQPLHPPKPLAPDGFTPGSTPPATALTPGERTVPVKNGIEDLPKAPATAKIERAPTTTGATSATSEAATTHAAAKPAADAADAAKTSTAARSGTASSGVPLSKPAAKPASSQTSNPVAHSPGAASSGVASSSGKPASSAGSLKPDTKVHVIVDGPENRAPRPSSTFNPPASGSSTQPAPKPVTPARNGPVVVPDDGSRPPATMPKRPADSNSSPAPQGHGA